MGYLEAAGTAANLLAVWLMVRSSAWTWPVGLVAASLFAALFYQVRLYADVLEQVYYLATGFWGWWLWTRGAARAKRPVSRNPPGVNAALACGVVAATAALGALTARLDALWPSLFPAPASYPYWDAFTTAGGFFAQALAALRRLENWHAWIGVNVVSVGLYAAKGMPLVAGLYVLFLLLALEGLREWRREL